MGQFFPLLMGSFYSATNSQEERRHAIGHAWIANDLVFCGQHGEYLNPNRPSLWLKRLLKDAGIGPMRFHDLRHSAATLLLAMGVHVKVVQELLGHKTLASTEKYTHVSLDKLANMYDTIHPVHSMIKKKNQKI